MTQLPVMPVIKPISAQDTYGIRQAVLRPGHPPETCIFEGDDNPENFHLGAFQDDELMGIVSFMKDNNKYFSGDQYRIRGMAVLPEVQGKGLGKSLVNEGEKILQEKKVPMLWFNAREIALPFYKKLGFSLKGEAFEIPSVGTHYVMYKEFLY